MEVEMKDYSRGDDHQELIQVLLSSPTKRDAARRLGISEGTLYRRLRDPEIKEAYRQARMDSLAETTASLQVASFEAAAALRSLATDVTVNPHVRLGACRAILDLAYRAAEIDDVRAEIEQLKAELGARI
jgi:AcrR family transcriptional regulator